MPPGGAAGSTRRSRPLPDRRDREEGALEALHVLGTADRDADVRRPHGPWAADVDVLSLELLDCGRRGHARVDHEVVGDGRRVAEAMRIEEAHQVGAALFVAALACGD